MFTGIIIDLGKLRTLEQRGDTRFTIETGFDATTFVRTPFFQGFQRGGASDQQGSSSRLRKYPRSNFQISFNLSMLAD